MQAKFLQVPGEAHQDADWLVGQLREELDKFAGPESELREPDYYILVTNARLSPMPANKRRAGGQAKIDTVFKEYQGKLGLKGWRVWHLDQLNSLLANADALRRSYAAWLTGSDVIAKLIESLDLRSQAFNGAMYRYLARELRSHQPLRLQQAGHSGDARTMIEDVFIDLPFKPFGKAVREDSERLLLVDLLEWSRDRLDVSSAKAQRTQSFGRPERVLLLGGPGQGKSTVTQFLAQIFRANMLAADRQDEISSEIRAIVESTLNKASKIGLTVSVPRRFPLRIDLPNFADTLSKGSADGARRTLIGYLADHIAAVAETSVDIEDLRTWIREYPCALILDGLDEVPTSADRTSVIRAINEFWDDAPNADALMVVTTRPQGYNDELDPAYYDKLEMTPLGPLRAVACAEKLAVNRITDLVHRQRVLERLREAAKAATTARLMVSPLQVAIMLALIDQRGDAPTDRWSLFDKYFGVVLEREQAKAGPTGHAMRHWGRQIVAVHHKVGFLLHVEAEKRGNSEAYLSFEEFAKVIRGQLSDEGYEGEELEQNTAQLVSGSTERLVLLVQREEGRFSFEVRSLQEFMAAAYLMSGREATVQKRLRTVASCAHWLHVFQIAASKCFAIADAEQYRDTIVTLCRDLNENGSPIDRLLRTGSVLALALLDDGLAYDQPKYRRLLFFLALELLDAGPAALPESLSTHCEREPIRTVEKVRPYFASTLKSRRRAAWVLAIRCATAGQSWAETLLKDFWPHDSDEVVELFAQRIDVPEDSWLYVRMRAAMEATSPRDARECVLKSENGRSWVSGARMIESMPVLHLLDVSPFRPGHTAIRLSGAETPLHLSFCKLRLTSKQSEAYEDLPQTPAWVSLRAVRDFHHAPSRSLLADLLEQAVQQDWLSLYESITDRIPWPLASLVRVCGLADDPSAVISQVRTGLFGDTADWLRAEERWEEVGVTAADLAGCASGNFFDHRIGEVGVPLSRFSIAAGNEETDWVTRLIEFARNAKGAPAEWLIAGTRFVLSVYSPGQPLDVAAMLDILDFKRGQKPIEAWPLHALQPKLLAQPAILDRLQVFGLKGTFFSPYEHFQDEEIYSALIEALPDRPGLLVPLANMMATDERRDRFLDIPEDLIKALRAHESPIVSSYAWVISVATGGGKSIMASEILSELEKKQNIFPIWLLRQCLKNATLVNTAPRLADLVARTINANPAAPHQVLMSRIQAIANARVSSLHSAECWADLELGDTLFAQAIQRRERMAAT
ncbi:hypothetical protein CLD20_07660 [Afifella sp. IM 167]|nr:hypothetical protein [Afifella sp. IM 167]